MTEYQRIKDYIAQGRDGASRPLANNTRYVDRGEAVAIKLHETDVVTFHENGDVSFDSGGWRTVTTKDRMHFAGDFSIYSDSGEWYIYHRGRKAQIERNLRRKYGLPLGLDEFAGEYEYEDRNGLISLGHVGPRGRGFGFWHEVGELIGFSDAARIAREFQCELQDRSVCLFHDGIRFTTRGKPVNALPLREARAQVKADERTRKAIREFAKLAVLKLDEGMPVQNQGDCWYCLMRTADEQPNARDLSAQLSYSYRFHHLRGMPLGDAVGDHDHLREHIREGYVPSALLLNAMDEQPYAHTAGKAFALGIHEGEDGEQRMGGLTPAYGGTLRRRHSAETVAKATYEFVARRLLPGREVRGNFYDADFPMHSEVVT